MSHPPGEDAATNTHAHAGDAAGAAAAAAEGEGGPSDTATADGTAGVGAAVVGSARAVENPTEYSHWLSRSLPLDDLTRLRLLACDSTTERLRMAVKLLQVRGII